MTMDDEEEFLDCIYCGEEHETVAEIRRCEVNFDGTTPAQREQSKITWQEVDEGVWTFGDPPQYIRIQRTRDGQNLYGKKFMGSNDQTGKPEWDYLAFARKVVAKNGGRRVTAEEAIAFGREYGQCMICGRMLRNKKSIERAIGPICWAKLGGC